jgi:hypothetical protein
MTASGQAKRKECSKGVVNNTSPIRRVAIKRTRCGGFMDDKLIIYTAGLKFPF